MCSLGANNLFHSEVTGSVAKGLKSTLNPRLFDGILTLWAILMWFHAGADIAAMFQSTQNTFSSALRSNV